MAGNITFGGLSSGLDTAAIINAIATEAEAPLRRVTTQISDLGKRRTSLTAAKAAADSIASALRAIGSATNLLATRAATVADAAQLSATASSSAPSGTYRLRVDRMATATVARSTARAGQALTDADLSLNIADLPIAGSVAAGTVRVVVDGHVTAVTVGAPASTSLGTVVESIRSAMESSAQGTDPGVAVSAAIVDNRLSFTFSGGAASHSVSFGAAGDSSALFSVVGLSASTATVAANGTLTGSRQIGVVRTSGALDAAGLTGLASTSAGVLTVNGVEISYDTTADSLSTIVARINASKAGATASMDRANDRIVLTAKEGGPAAISIEDTAGTLAAALNLAPGTTNAQTAGLTALVSVDGTVVSAASNTPADLIDGVTLSLKAVGTTETVMTVGPNAANATAAIKGVVDAYNALADLIGKETAKGGTIATDSAARRILADVRTALLSPKSGAAGSIRGLMDAGVSTGAFGAAVGSTTRLSLDTAKLAAVLAADTEALNGVIGGAAGTMGLALAKVNTFAGTAGAFKGSIDGLDASERSLKSRQAALQRSADDRRTAIAKKYAALEQTLSKLNTQSSSVSASTSTAKNG
jgi:flagellar hook-associated protein 2